MNQQRETYDSLVAGLQALIPQVMPWDVPEAFEGKFEGLVLDVREPQEYEFCHMPGAIHVPRGTLEAAVDYGYDETVNALAEAREKRVLVVCRSGKRSTLAARTLQLMGYHQVINLKTGVRGAWEAGFSLFNNQGEVAEDDLEKFFYPKAAMRR